MSYFRKSFLEKIGAVLEDEIKAADKRYAALLYYAPSGTPLDRLDQHGNIKSCKGNTEIRDKNPNSHAEINVIDDASTFLYDNMFNKSTGNLKNWRRREWDFYLFVNTRSCPKCTAAIVDAQIFSTYFFFENHYKKEISEQIIQAKSEEVGRRFTFEEIDVSMGLRYKFRQML